MRHRTCFRMLILPVAAFLFVPLVHAQDPETEAPGRSVARVSLINGDVSVRRGDSGDWVAAAVNAPLVVQDQVGTGPNSRAEVQFDYANFLRLGANSEVRLTELENRRYQVQVARGTVTYVVLRNSQADVDVSTPVVSVRPSKRGEYRITVQEDGQTEVTVRSGDVEIYTPRGVEQLHSGQTMLARGTASDPEYQILRASAQDDWDRWNERRDRDLERSNSYRYVSQDIYGAEDLDAHGQWVFVPDYGYCWRPVVVAGWAPYRMGRWVWMDWYGWTWVSYDPWGWAPYHYGRWFYSGPYGGWCWYPGGLHARHYWSPALVAFFGFGGYSGVHVGVGFGFGNVGWVPLAPREPFYPWYGRGYYGRYRDPVYISRNTNITNINVTNVYRNARVNNGITAVNATDFSRGRFNSNNFVRVSQDQIRQAGLVRGQMPITPAAESLRYSDRAVTNIPRTSANERFFTRRQPAAVERIPFQQQQRAFGGGTAPAIAPAARGANAPAAATVAPANSQNGWRRSGEPARGQSASPVVTLPRGNSTNDSGGWRRLGEQRQPGTAPAVTPASPARGDTPARDNNWRRFGDTPRQNQNSAPAPAVRDSSPRNQDNGWHRFGQPNSAAPSSPSRGPRDSGNNLRPSETRQTPNTGGGAPRFDSRSQSPSMNRGRQESIQVAPPVVRERSNSMPRSEPRNYTPSRSYSAPRGGEMRTPSFSRGDGGSRSSGGGSSRGGGGGSSQSGGGGSSHGGRR